jgi:hypothetical protein
MSFTELLTEHVATATARQLALADLLEERDWRLDLTTGTARFGDDLQYPIQVLGTESTHDGTWLWGWANEASGLDPRVLRLGAWLRDYGTRAGVPELTEAEQPLRSDDHGHRLALVASGLSGRCYYRGPYDGGAVYFHLENTPPAVDGPVDPERALTVINHVLMAFPLPHRAMFGAFLRQQGWAVRDEPDAIAARHGSGSEIRLELDHAGRVSRIGGELKR